ncbi:MAG: CBS domain-containing protein [Acetobacteraceae bacterium]
MKAGDVMADQVLTVTPETTIQVAIALMTENHISGLPVLGAENKLVGILTEGDLLQRAETGTEHAPRPKWLEFLLGPGREAAEYVQTHSQLVGDLMTDEVVSVTEDVPLRDVVALMEKRRIRRVPVLRDGHLVGIISRADLVRALGRKLAATPAPGGSDDAIGAALRAELAKQSWVGPNTNIDIVVHGGVVTLDGVIFDERSRDALRVAAQNVAGVTSVVDRLVWVEPTTGDVVPGV